MSHPCNFLKNSESNGYIVKKNDFEYSILIEFISNSIKYFYNILKAFLYTYITHFQHFIDVPF